MLFIFKIIDLSPYTFKKKYLVKKQKNTIYCGILKKFGSKKDLDPDPKKDEK